MIQLVSLYVNSTEWVINKNELINPLGQRAFTNFFISHKYLFRLIFQLSRAILFSFDMYYCFSFDMYSNFGKHKKDLGSYQSSLVKNIVCDWPTYSMHKSCM